MKILILVLSYNESPYKELMRAQQETWDSIEVEGVRTVYYYGGNKGWVNEKEFSANASDEYYYMTNKCLEAIKATIDFEPTLIWRTNSSSYIQKSKLVEFAKTLPTENCYAGWEIEGQGYNVVSGAGFFMSPDVAEKLIANADPNFCREEDCYISEVLFNQGVPIIDDKSRYDLPAEFDSVPADRYHYRLKCGGRRDVDIANMKTLHQKIISQ